MDRVRSEAEKSACFHRSQIKGCIYHDPHAQVCYFSTHTGTRRMQKNILMTCLVSDMIVPIFFPSRTRYPWELVQLPTFPCSRPPSKSWHKHRRLLEPRHSETPLVLWSLDGEFRVCTSWQLMTALPIPSFHIRASVFGMLCVQVWRYYQRYPNDHWSYKVLVSMGCMFHPKVADTLCLLFDDARAS